MGMSKPPKFQYSIGPLALCRRFLYLRIVKINLFFAVSEATVNGENLRSLIFKKNSWCVSRAKNEAFEFWQKSRLLISSFTFEMKFLMIFLPSVKSYCKVNKSCFSAFPGISFSFFCLLCKKAVLRDIADCFVMKPSSGSFRFVFGKTLIKFRVLSAPVVILQKSISTFFYLLRLTHLSTKWRNLKVK